MKRLCASAALLLMIFARLEAQDEKPVFQIAPIDAREESPEEALMLENLVRAYFSDKNDIVLVPRDDSAPDEMPAVRTRQRGPNYIVKCSLYHENDSRVFEVIVSDSGAREVSRSTARYKTTKDIALNMKSIVNSAFEWRTASLDTSAAPVPEALTPEKLFGQWRGDAGIKFVRILPDGKAFAFFASGANMMLSYKIEGDTLTVSQVSPNNENFYYPLPREAAKVLVKEAEPMRWEMKLYGGGNLLGGIRAETVIDSEDYEKMIIRHNSVRKSEWERLPR